MGSLSSKKILICRSKEKSMSFTKALQKAGAEVHFLESFIIADLSEKMAAETRQRLQSLQGIHWLVLSSVNGFNAFAGLLEEDIFPEALLASLKIGIVGKKTTRAWKAAFPNLPIGQVSENMQQLLNLINEKTATKTPLHVLHLCSQASVKYIHPALPHGLVLKRVPVYQTLPNLQANGPILQKIRDGSFDTLVFSSPSSFQYLRQLLKDDACLKQLPLSAFGPTTQAHITQNGFNAPISPRHPSPASLVAALVDYFDDKHLSDSLEDAAKIVENGPHPFPKGLRWRNPPLLRGEGDLIAASDGDDFFSPLLPGEGPGVRSEHTQKPQNTEVK